MGRKDPRIDTYIAKSADFAKPILKHLREIVHEGCPDVEETLKWSMPHFDYHGGPLAGMAAFKEHCALGFWKGSLIVPGSKEAMGQFGRITRLADLPSDRTLVGYVRKAAKLASDPPMGSAEPIVWLSIVSIGTIGAMAAMLIDREISPLWTGFLMAAVDVVAAFALARFALWRSGSRPGRSLQLGQLVSAGWCINTAALVLYMILKVPA